ncbi:hypothetical protein D3C75_811580 [compost metagenome]
MGHAYGKKKYIPPGNGNRLPVNVVHPAALKYIGQLHKVMAVLHQFEGFHRAVYKNQAVRLKEIRSVKLPD